MEKKIIKSLFALIAIIYSSTAFAAPDKALKDEKGLYSSGHILVKAKPGVSDNRFLNILAKRSVILDHKINQIDVSVVKVPPGLEKKIIDDLLQEEIIDFAELDRFVEPSLISNDPNFSSQWLHSKIGTASAWDIASADNIIIAVLDTGILASHTDLQAVTLTGWNIINQNTDVTDINGHGTLVSGIAASTFNNAIGGSGVARNAKILPIKITIDPSGYALWSDVSNAIIYAADNGARVVSNSYASYTSSTVLSAASYLKNKGGIMFAAAGNSGAICSVPADSRIMVVGATDQNDAKASWSNYGDCVDIVAPGVDLYTTTNNGGYGGCSGTSCSTPATSGLAALIYGTNPQLSADDVESIIKKTIVDLGTIGRDEYYGDGRINALAAVTMAKTYVPTVKDTTLPSVSISSPIANSVVNGVVTVNANAADNVGVSKVDLNVNGILYTTDTTAPYSFSWDTSPLGNANVNLTATAYDAAGNKTTSSVVFVKVQNVVDTTPPVVTFSSPVNGGIVSGNAAIKVSAIDNVGISKIILLIDGIQVTSINGSTLSYNWNTRKIAIGNHVIKAIATDTSGITSEMAIQVTVKR